MKLITLRGLDNRLDSSIMQPLITNLLHFEQGRQLWSDAVKSRQLEGWTWQLAATLFAHAAGMYLTMASCVAK